MPDELTPEDEAALRVAVSGLDSWKAVRAGHVHQLLHALDAERGGHSAVLRKVRDALLIIEAQRQENVELRRKVRELKTGQQHAASVIEEQRRENAELRAGVERLRGVLRTLKSERRLGLAQVAIIDAALQPGEGGDRG